MVNKQKLNNLFPNFNSIIECEFLEDDLLTKKIIEYYQNYISDINENEQNELSFAKKLDDAVYNYIEDYHFAKSFKDTIDIAVIVSNKFNHHKQFLEYIVSFMEEYNSTTKPKQAETNWI